MGHSMPGFRMTVVDSTGAKLEAFKGRSSCCG